MQKTEVLLFGSRDASKVHADQGPLTQDSIWLNHKSGVRLDKDLNLGAQIKSQVKSSFYPLRQLAKVKK